MMTTKIPKSLEEAMQKLNEITGHPEHPRYFLERRPAATNYDHTVWQIRKCVGKDSVEISRWLSRSQVPIWIEGAIEAITSEARRLERDDRRSLAKRIGMMPAWALDEPSQVAR